MTNCPGDVITGGKSGRKHFYKTITPKIILTAIHPVVVVHLTAQRVYRIWG